MVQPAEQLAGIVLCGGSSRRMGAPKYSLPFGEETLLQRTVRLVGEVCQPVIVVAAPDQILPEFNSSEPESILVVRDEWPGEGPLTGLLTGLKQVPETHQAAFVCGCDTPLLKPKLISFLADQLGDQDAVVPTDSEYDYPLTAIYQIKVKTTLASLHEQGERKLRLLLQELDTREVSLGMLALVDSQLDSFRNINTPEEYEATLKLAGLSPQE